MLRTTRLLSSQSERPPLNDGKESQDEPFPPSSMNPDEFNNLVQTSSLPMFMATADAHTGWSTSLAARWTSFFFNLTAPKTLAQLHEGFQQAAVVIPELAFSEQWDELKKLVSPLVLQSYKDTFELYPRGTFKFEVSNVVRTDIKRVLAQRLDDDDTSIEFDVLFFQQERFQVFQNASDSEPFYPAMHTPANVVRGLRFRRTVRHPTFVVTDILSGEDLLD